MKYLVTRGFTRRYSFECKGGLWNRTGDAVAAAAATAASAAAAAEKEHAAAEAAAGGLLDLGGYVEALQVSGRNEDPLVAVARLLCSRFVLLRVPIIPKSQ